MRARSSIIYQRQTGDIYKHRNRTSTPNKEKKGTVRIQENPEQ